MKQKEVGYFLKLPVDIKEYLERQAHNSYRTVKQYIVDMLLQDMDKNKENNNHNT